MWDLIKGLFWLAVGSFILAAFAWFVMLPFSYIECRDFAYQTNKVTKMSPITLQCYAEVDGYWIPIEQLRTIEGVKEE